VRGIEGGDLDLQAKSLVATRPEEAAELAAMAQAVATERYRKYEELARQDGSRFHPAAGSVDEACALGGVAGFAESGSTSNGAAVGDAPV
jgi:hypothetical protein